MKFFKFVFLILLCLSLTACSLNTDESSINEFTNTIIETVSNTGILEGTSEIFTYVQNTQESFQELMNISGQWSEVFNAATTGEITNEELALTVTNEILPLNEELVTQIEGFVPPTDATAIINDLLVNAVTTQHDALLEVANSLQNSDFSSLNSANEMMSQVQGIEGEFTKMIQNIMTEYGF